MDPLLRIQNFAHLKTLADARRLTILRLLMAEAMTLSQIGQVTGDHPAQVRHHLKQLEKAGLVELVDTRVVRGFIEKYYRARAQAFLLQEMILPAGEQEAIAILGSHDLALEALAQHLGQRERYPLKLLVLPIGSLEGLIALRQGTAQMAGCHLLDLDSGEYNLPFVRHLFPDQPVALVTLADRQQGFLVAPGNPKGITSLQDLRRPDVSMVNRMRGSGTRLWLDRQLQLLSVPTVELRGYSKELRTHTAVAEAVSQGKADVGVGLYAAARQYDLEFIPLFEERFDLALPRGQIEAARLRPFLDFLPTASCRKIVAGMGGYNPEHSGDWLVP